MSYRIGWTTAIFLTAIVLIGGFGCSSSGASGDPWTTHYVGSPDDVWDAIHISLIDLNYDVERENRDEGTIRAVRDAGEAGPAAVLSIDQVMRTNDVNVYVRVAGTADGPVMSRDQQAALAREFLAGVNGLLYE